MQQRSLFKPKQVKSTDLSNSKSRPNSTKVNTDTLLRNQESPDNYIYCKIQQRRLQMLVHSCLYYEFNTSLITDSQFDSWARELVTLQLENPDISEQVKWAEEFKDWDGTTGFHLPLREPWVVDKAYHLLEMEEQRNVEAD